MNKEKRIQSFDRKETPERPRHIWNDSIKTNAKGIEWRDIHWIHLSQDWKHWKASNSVTSCAASQDRHFPALSYARMDKEP
jgi:hypothetical protein